MRYETLDLCNDKVYPICSLNYYSFIFSLKCYAPLLMSIITQKRVFSTLKRIKIYLRKAMFNVAHKELKFYVNKSKR